MKRSSIGGQAVLEGVMMKSEDGIALAVRKSDGTIVTQYTKCRSKVKKGTFFGFPIVRGVVAFVESLTVGMNTIQTSAELYGEGFEEEPTKFEKFLAEKLGKDVDKVVMSLAVVLAIALAVGLFFVLPTVISSLVFGSAEIAPVCKSLLEGLVRLLIFLGYLVAVSFVPDIKRVFMYHGAEHKTIACYEAEAELTPENAKRFTRLHPRCGTNYLFLVMAISILFFAAVGWGDSALLRIATRLIFLPVVAGISYEVLKAAAKSDCLAARIARAPGLALQRITTREPDESMLEVAITAFNLALDPNARQIYGLVKTAEKEETPAEAETSESPAEANKPAEAAASEETAEPADAEPAEKTAKDNDAEPLEPRGDAEE